jgi:hypothetical protein
MIIISTHAPRMIPSEHLSRQRAGMNGIFDLSLVKNISLVKRFEFFDHEIMKLALIAIGLLATTGVVYAACVFSDTKKWLGPPRLMAVPDKKPRSRGRPGLVSPGRCCLLLSSSS